MNFLMACSYDVRDDLIASYGIRLFAIKDWM